MLELGAILGAAWFGAGLAIVAAYWYLRRGAVLLDDDEEELPDYPLGGTDLSVKGRLEHIRFVLDSIERDIERGTVH